MRFRARSTFVSAAAAALVVSSAGLAVADNVVVDGDELTGSTATLSLGEVCLGESGAKTVGLQITRDGANTSANVYDNGAVVTVSGGTVSAARGTVSTLGTTITLPSDWVTSGNDNNKVSSMESATVNVSVGGDVSPGPGSVTLTFTATGKKYGSTSLVNRTDDVQVSWTAVDCAPSDTLPPEISYSLNPSQPNGLLDWYTSDVMVTWHVSDSSGIAETSDCKDGATNSLNYDTTGEAFSCTATDIYGNSETVTTESIKRDATAPSITWGAGSPGEGDDAEYYFGDTIPEADCTAEDATSGVTEEGCSVTGGGTTVGTHTLTASATDNAGNTATDTRSYEVLAWTIDGFYRPVDMGADKVNTVKAGSTVPLKFNVLKGDEPMAAGIGATFSAKRSTCEGIVSEDAIEEFSETGKTVLRYDADGQQWIQNWATPKSGAGNCYLVTVTTADGTSKSAKFQLK